MLQLRVDPASASIGSLPPDNTDPSPAYRRVSRDDSSWRAPGSRSVQDPFAQWDPPTEPLPSHRRTGSENTSFRFPSSKPSFLQSHHAPMYDTSTYRAQSSYEQQHRVLQQQIEQLQQQQQMLRQQQLYPPLPSLDEVNESPMRSHRRIQSQSAMLGEPSFERFGQRLSPRPELPGLNTNFSFPARPSDSRNVPRSPFGPQRSPSHTRHASYQLTTLAPEFLAVAGGLIQPNAMNNTWVSDFADMPPSLGPAPKPRGGHLRSVSTGSAMWGSATPSTVSAPAAAPAAGVTNSELLENLTQAQSQLAALHRSRMQTGPHAHTRSASYSGQRNVSGGQQQRKALFGSYLPQSSLPPLLITGKLVIGMLRVNKRNRSDAWVTTEVLDRDIFISGSKDRNRALEGDLVAVELLDPVDVWVIKKEKEGKKKRKDDDAGVSSHSGRRPDKIRDDLEVEGAQRGLVEDEEHNDDSPPALAGHVVAIVERTPGQIFPGTLGVNRPSSTVAKPDRNDAPRPKIIWFRPTDKRVPLIAIPSDQAPADFWEVGGPERYATSLFVASIKRWPLTSLHPFGTLVDRLGEIGSLEAESSAILRGCCSQATADFSESALRAVPTPDWEIPASERDRRTFNGMCWSVKHDNSGELDFALSVEKSGTAMEIGIHASDVSFFVRPGSPLDREASKRSTAVHVVGHDFLLLPSSFGANAVAFVPGKERLAISVVLSVDENGAVTHSWIGRSIVKAQSALSLKEIQHVAENGGDEASSILKQLVERAAALGTRRASHGALDKQAPELVFKVDGGQPTEARFEHDSGAPDAKRLVDELAIRANMAVAYRIAAVFPEAALLRRQETPSERRLQTLQATVQRLGASLDVSSPGTLQHSLERLRDNDTRMVAEALVRHTLVPSKYYCTGMVDIAKFSHYGHNTPLYTHFCSPLHSYAVICVHRQLAAALNGTPVSSDISRNTIAKVAQQCNVQYTAMCRAKEQSTHLYLCQLIHAHTLSSGLMRTSALVMTVGENSFNVLVPEYGLEKRIQLSCMPLATHRWDAAQGALMLEWRDMHVLQHMSEILEDAHSLEMWQRVSHEPKPKAVTQTVAPLSRVDVYIVADLQKSPPSVKVFVANPN